MNIDAIIIGCIVGLSGLYALFNIFGVVGLSSGIAVIVIYGILLKLNPEKPKEKTVFQNIRIKLPVIMIFSWHYLGRCRQVQLPNLVANRIRCFCFCGLLFLYLTGLENA